MIKKKSCRTKEEEEYKKVAAWQMFGEDNEINL
jgi:hypothetical protein